MLVEHRGVLIGAALPRVPGAPWAVETVEALEAGLRLPGQTGADRLTKVEVVVRRALEPGELSDAAAQVETDRVGLDLHLGTLLPGAVLPVADPQFAGHDDRLALAQAGGRVAGQRPPAVDRVEVGIPVLPLPRL